MSRQYISVYVRNAEEGPSCYYRVIQYINKIENYQFKINNAFTTKEYRTNINLKSKYIKKAYQLILLMKVMYRRYRDIRYDLRHNPDCIIVSREFYPRFAFRFLLNQLSVLLNSYKIIWDFDDDILTLGEISKEEMKKLEQYSDRIIVTHQHLKKTLKPNCHNKTMTMPTTDRGCTKNEFTKMIVNREKLLKEKVNLVWVGTSNNLEFLEIIIDALDKASVEIEKNEGKYVLLNVVCNVPYHPKKKVNHIQIKNYKWKRETANRVMMISHVGIMPLSESKITEGKGAFKLIQYLSFGIPIIASPVGFNKQVVNNQCGFLADKDNDWKVALSELTTDISIWRRYAQGARNRYETNFSYNKNLSIWQRLIEEMVGEL